MYPKNKNTDDFYETQYKIWTALSDGQWHRTKNLKETTKLSPRTLHKHLKRLVNSDMIERKIDKESGKYPIPVLYKAQPEVIEYVKTSEIRKQFSDKIDAMLKETKNNPLVILDMIHRWNEMYFIRILRQIQNQKDMTFEDRETQRELFLELNYRYFTRKLIEASNKIINEIDIDKCLIAQVKLRKEESEYIYNFFDELAKNKDFQNIMEQYQSTQTKEINQTKSR
jgi:DNA-binding HxlR family transcriptional regulator